MRTSIQSSCSRTSSANTYCRLRSASANAASWVCRSTLARVSGGQSSCTSKAISRPARLVGLTRMHRRPTTGLRVLRPGARCTHPHLRDQRTGQVMMRRLAELLHRTRLIWTAALMIHRFTTRVVTRTLLLINRRGRQCMRRFLPH